MIQKIKQWFANRRLRGTATGVARQESELYTREQVMRMMEQAKQIGYNEGRSDGLAVARQQAVKSLKEILWQQNKQTKTK